MLRKILRLMLLLLLLVGGYWGYARLMAVDPGTLPPQIAEETPEARLAALKRIHQEQAQRPELQLGSVEIQHLLISFSDPAVSDSPDLGERSQQEAEQLAADLFSQARAGEDFDDLVRRYTDDSPPGLFRLAQDLDSLDPDLAQDAVARADFFSAIGDVSWRLEVGEVGVACYAPSACPLGWHLIKRLR